MIVGAPAFFSKVRVRFLVPSPAELMAESPIV